jgi:hypothetical protein
LALAVRRADFVLTAKYEPPDSISAQIEIVPYTRHCGLPAEELISLTQTLLFYDPATGATPQQELAQARSHFFLPRRFENAFDQSGTVPIVPAGDATAPLKGPRIPGEH